MHSSLFIYPLRFTHSAWCVRVLNAACESGLSRPPSSGIQIRAKVRNPTLLDPHGPSSQFIILPKVPRQCEIIEHGSFFTLLEQMKTNLPIGVDPEIMSGAPVFRGTRVPVQSLFEYLEDNMSLEELLGCFATVRGRILTLPPKQPQSASPPSDRH